MSERPAPDSPADFKEWSRQELDWLRERGRRGEVVQGVERITADQTVIRTERAMTKAEWLGEHRERERLDREYRRRRRAGLDRCAAGDRKRGAAEVAAANRWYRKRLAHLDQRAQAQTTTTVERKHDTARTVTAPRSQPRQRGAGRPAARRRSTTSRDDGDSGSSDADGPGEAGPPLLLVEPPNRGRCRYAYARLGAAERGADVEPIRAR